MVRSTDCLDMTIAVDWEVKPQTKQNCFAKIDNKNDVLKNHCESQT